jgi:hypothetical protein
MTGKAATDAQRTDKVVGSLAANAQKIGDVAGLIASIAEQNQPACPECDDRSGSGR